jgi:hypothetical protein
MCGLWVRVGLVPASRTVGRPSDGTCGKAGLARGRRRAPLVRWPLPVSAGLCGAGRHGGTGRRGPVRQYRRGTSAGVTPRGRGRVGAAPRLSLTDDVRLPSTGLPAANRPCAMRSLAPARQCRPANGIVLGVSARLRLALVGCRSGRRLGVRGPCRFRRFPTGRRWRLLRSVARGCLFRLRRGRRADRLKSDAVLAHAALVR